MSLTDRLENCYSGIIHDVMQEMGFRDFTLPPDLRPLLPEQRLAGPAWTFSGAIKKGSDPYQTVYEWTGVLSRAPAGHVLVCQPNDSTIAHMGELSAETLKLKGVRGYIVDGGCRDSEFIVDIGFQVFCRYFTPRDVLNGWLPHGFEDPISIGDATINSGDYMLADRDGVVVLPAEAAEVIVNNAETAMATEDQVRAAILNGMDPQEAFVKFQKF